MVSPKRGVGGSNPLGDVWIKAGIVTAYMLNIYPLFYFMVYAPLTGQVKPLSEVPDETFSKDVLGRGAAIISSEGKLYSPVDGKVSTVMDTRHALGISGPGESELLIHIGLEIVSLGGKYFSPKVKEGDEVKVGDLLIEFDLEAIKKDFKTITPVLIMNADDYDEIIPMKTDGNIQAGEPFYEVK